MPTLCMEKMVTFVNRKQNKQMLCLLLDCLEIQMENRLIILRPDPNVSGT
jgi:hypothetical protein